MPEPGTRIQLSDDDRKKLGGLLSEMVTDVEDEQSAKWDSIRLQWKWYDAVPRSKIRQFPFRNASNVVVPIIRTAADSIIARQFTLLHGSLTRIWTGRSESERFAEDYLNDVLAFLNWAARNEFDTFFSTLDWITEEVVIGESVLHVRWRDDQRTIMVPGDRRRKPVKVSVARGPALEHIPRHQLFWQSGVPIAESEFIFRQSFLTWTDMVRRALDVDDDGAPLWDRDAVEKTKNHTHEQGSPGAEVEESREEEEGVSSLSTRGIYDIRTAHLEWPLFRAALGRKSIVEPGDQEADRESVPIVVEFCPDSQQVFRVISNPYVGTVGWPYFDTYFRKRSGRASSPGVAKILELLQRGVTTMVNQAIDSITLANALPAKTVNPKWRDRTLQPGQMVLVDDMNDMQPIPMAKGVGPDIAMVQFLLAVGERVSGVNDARLGREARTGGVPSPATNFLAMLQQSRELDAPGVRTLRHQFSRVGEFIAALYQQFETDPEGRIVRVFGPEDGARINQWLFPRDEAIVGNLKLDIFTMSETQNPDQERQKAVLVSQMTQNYFAQTLPMLQQLANPQLPPAIRAGITKSVTALTKSHVRFLEASDVDNLEDFVLELRGVNREGATESLQALASELTGGGQRLLPPGAGLAGAAPGAGAVPFPGLGGAPEGAAPRTRPSLPGLG